MLCDFLFFEIKPLNFKKNILYLFNKKNKAKKNEFKYRFLHCQKPIGWK